MKVKYYGQKTILYKKVRKIVIIHTWDLEIKVVFAMTIQLTTSLQVGVVKDPL